MTLLQAVFSLHSIMCFFYGCSTFFHPEVTVELGLARAFAPTARVPGRLHLRSRGPAIWQCIVRARGRSHAPGPGPCGAPPRSARRNSPPAFLRVGDLEVVGVSDRDWLRRENTVLIQLHGACVLGLGLVAISAAQFEYADPRSLLRLPPPSAPFARRWPPAAALEWGGAVRLTRDKPGLGCRNIIAKCMLGLHVLLSYAMLQDWKPGGQTQTPVMVATGIMSILYSICCTFFPDRDMPVAARTTTNHEKQS